MSDQTAYHLNIIIDKLTNSVVDSITGESFKTKIAIVTKSDLLMVRRKKGEWNFNWKTEFNQADRVVYKLMIVAEADKIQGLVSISNMGDHCYLHLAESAPANFGAHKKYQGVGGNLFAYCCKLSWDNGNDGIIAFKSKTLLIEHYEKGVGSISHWQS